MNNTVTQSNMISFTQADFKDTERVAMLVKSIDNAPLAYFEGELEEIEHCQPFMLSLMLGYKYDLTPGEHSEAIMMFILVWMYFKEHQSIRSTPLTQEQFEMKHHNNMQFFKYLEGETFGSLAHTMVTAGDMQRMQSKALWTAIIYQFKERKTLQSLKGEPKAMLLIDLKSTIDGLEEIRGKLS